MIDFKPKNQRGYALLITTLVILLGITITALMVSKAVYFEQKMVAEDYYSQQAFQAAEAGLASGLSYLNTHRKDILIQDQNKPSFIHQIIQANQKNNTSYHISLSNPVLYSFSRIKISAKGMANQGQSIRTITQQVQLSPFFLTLPPVPLTVKGIVSLGGNSNISNLKSPFTLVSGGKTHLNQKATTHAADKMSSSTFNLQSDIMQDDFLLDKMSSQQFFEGFFGTNKETAQQNVDLLYNNQGNLSLSNTSIWISRTQTSVLGQLTLGSPTNPVVLVIDGPLSTTKPMTIYGIVYVIGDWNNESLVEVIGAAVVEGNLSSPGTLNINYDHSVLLHTAAIGNFVEIPGSWIDD